MSDAIILRRGTNRRNKGVPWATGTDAEIKAMIDAADAGEIDLHDYWSVGDTRTVHLSASSVFPNNLEDLKEQDVQFVLMDRKCTGFKFSNGGGTPRFIVGLKNTLSDSGGMEASGYYSEYWQTCERRVWCNNTFKQGIPSTFRSIFKPFTWKLCNADRKTLFEVTDTFALPPIKATDVWHQYRHSEEDSLYEQWEWYKTSENLVKKRGNTSNNVSWNTASEAYLGYVEYSEIGYYFKINPDKSAGVSEAWGGGGISPFGCI